MNDPKPKRTGTVVRYAPAKPGETNGHFVVRCPAPDGTRPLFHLDPSPDTEQAREAARATAQSITAELWRTGLGAAPPRKRRQDKHTPTETVAEYADRWFAERERRGMSSVPTDRGRLQNHVLPLIGPRPIVRVTPDEIRAVVEHLDDTALAGTFSWRTAIKVWGVTTKMFADACSSKVAALRVRADNPCVGLRGPDRGEKRGKQWLYPSEVTALLACESVPLRWRRLYALAAYLYPRPGELAALEWRDINFKHRYVNIHQALNLRTDDLKPTKTGITRKTPIHPSVMPLLRLMNRESGGVGRVIQNKNPRRKSSHGFPPLEDLADALRKHLLRAGVDRADLHTGRTTTKRVTFYDLRATGITWEALAGTEPIRIMQRAGHTNFTTTQGYIREAEAVGLDAGEPFPRLPAALTGGDDSDPEPPTEGPGGGENGPLSQVQSQESASVPVAHNHSRNSVTPTGLEPVLPA